MEEIKQKVIASLEKQGILAKLKAELSCSIFQTIKDIQNSNAEKPEIPSLFATQKSNMFVVAKYLKEHNLESSLVVFKQEANMNERVPEDTPSLDSLMKGKMDLEFCTSDRTMSRSSTSDLNFEIFEGLKAD